MDNNNLKKPVNLIGINGKIGSGKDTVGSIIQYLTSESGNQNSSRHRSYEKFLSNGGDSALRNFDQHYVSDWEIKKFADKLKDMVCLIIGCTRADLENQEFKNKELGEEWSVYRSYLGEDHNIYSESSRKDISLSHTLTPRKILQLLGTDCMRDIIHPNIHINTLFSDYKLINNSGLRQEGLHFPNWCITDVRFSNEVKAIEDRGGIVIKLERNMTTFEGIEFMFKDGSSKFIKNIRHFSETNLDNHKFLYTIENNGTIEDLVIKVKEILVKEKII